MTTWKSPKNIYNDDLFPLLSFSISPEFAEDPHWCAALLAPDDTREKRCDKSIVFWNSSVQLRSDFPSDQNHEGKPACKVLPFRMPMKLLSGSPQKPVMIFWSQHVKWLPAGWSWCQSIWISMINSHDIQLYHAESQYLIISYLIRD